MGLSARQNRAIKKALVKLDKACIYLDKRSHYPCSIHCKLCGAGYGRHFSNCSCQVLPLIIKDLKEELYGFSTSRTTD